MILPIQKTFAYFVKHVKDISPKSYICWQICKIFRQNCISFAKIIEFVKDLLIKCAYFIKSFANFVIKIKHISTEFVKDLLLKCAYFTYFNRSVRRSH